MSMKKVFETIKLRTIDINTKIKIETFFCSSYDFKVNGDKEGKYTELFLVIDSALRRSRFLSDVDRCSRRYAATRTN